MVGYNQIKDKMATKSVSAQITKMTQKVTIEIDRNKLEAFMNSFGLFRRDFLKTLDESEEDHKAGRIKKRKSLEEI